MEGNLSLEFIKAIDIMIKKSKENDTKIYSGEIVSVEKDNYCTIKIFSNNYPKVKYYGEMPTIGKIYRVFSPQNNLSNAFILNTDVTIPDPTTGLDMDIISNDNGVAYKFSNGFMICTRKINVTINCSYSWGALYYGSDATEYNFAQEFTTVPVVSRTLCTTSDNSAMDSSYIRPIITSSSYKNLSIIRPTSNSSVPCEFNIIAIGLWK